MKVTMTPFQEVDLLNGATQALRSRHTGALRIYAGSEAAECTGCLICTQLLPTMDARLQDLVTEIRGVNNS